LKFVKEHLQAPFFKIVNLCKLTPDHGSLKKVNCLCAEDKVGLTFLALGSSGLSTSGTCLVIYSEEVFLLEEEHLEAGLAEERAIGTCLEGYSVGAFPMSFAKGGEGERIVSSTWVASCSEGPADFGVLSDL